MALATVSDYSAYRSGSTPVLSGTEFPYYEKQAEWELGRQTGGLLPSVTVVETVASIIVNGTTYTLVLDDLKGCLCEIAEFLYTFEKAFAQASGGILSSYSNDGQSGSFNNAAISSSGKTQQIRGIAKKYLSGTILMKMGVDLRLGGCSYIGGDCCESELC